LSEIRLLLFDLDGTLFTPDREILEENLRALGALMERGMLVSFATGRPPRSAHPIAEKVRVNAPLICMNGAQLYDHRHHRVIASEHVDKDVALLALKRTMAMGVHANVYVDDDIWVRTFGTEAEVSTKKDGVRPTHRPDLEAALAARAYGPNKILFITSPDRIEDLRASLSDLDEVDLVRSDVDYLELLPRGVHKGQGARHLADFLGLDVDEEVMAFGDQGNDAELLDVAAVGVAMGNATDALKEHADVVIGSNEAPSIAAFLRARFPDAFV